MPYKLSGGKIIFSGAEFFDIRDSLECGQVFRYRLTEDGGEVISRDKRAVLRNAGDTVTIETDDPQYFVRYFDLCRDYGEIVGRAAEFPEVAAKAAAGKGIRLFRQDPFEAVISFIISANNNIPRIKKIIENLSAFCGDYKNGYYAFPTPQALAQVTENDFIKMGCGYRARYLTSTAQMLSDGSFIEGAQALADGELRKALSALKGVGGKVADCAMLFGFSRYSSFPSDTWIIKNYEREFGTRESSAKVSAYYAKRYGDISGFVQQYIFFDARERGNRNDKL